MTLAHPPRNFFARRWMLLIPLLTLAAYIPALQSGYIWDDEHYITGNVYLYTLHGLHQIWFRPASEPQYYPLTHTTFWLEYHLWGLAPFGYHLDNILLHIANALLVGLILKRLSVPGYALAAAIFALHPVQVESVAWITERKNVLSGFFFLTALWIALDVWKITPPSRKSRPIALGISPSPGTPGEGRGEGLPQHSALRTQHFPQPLTLTLSPSTGRGDKSEYAAGYALCLLLFILALLSKSVTSSLPIVILLLIAWRQHRITIRQVASIIPFLIPAAAMGATTAWMETHVVGATGPEFSWTFPQRLIIAGHAVWFYLAKLLWPHPLIFIYPKWTIDTGSFGQWIYPATVIAAITALFLLRRRIGTAPLIAALFFVISLFPALGFVNIYPMRYSFVADHFQYLASIGPIALLAVFLTRLHWQATAPLLLVLALLTFQQSRVYFDIKALWTDVVAKDPRSILGLTNLGVTFAIEGDLPAATDELNLALKFDPTFTQALVELGSIAQARGDNDQARSYFQTAENSAPTNSLPPWRLALLDQSLNDFPAAEAELTAVCRLAHNPAAPYVQLGQIALTLNDLPGAEKYFEKALTADPDWIAAHYYLGVVFSLEANPNSAAAQFRAALDLNPNYSDAQKSLESISR